MNVGPGNIFKISRRGQHIFRTRTIQFISEFNESVNFGGIVSYLKINKINIVRELLRKNENCWRKYASGHHKDTFTAKRHD